MRPLNDPHRGSFEFDTIDNPTLNPLSIMQDAQYFRQPVCESRKSDKIVMYLTGDKFTEKVQKMLDNGNVWDAYFERNGALVVEERDGRKHYNVLADGSHNRPVSLPKWLVVTPMTGGNLGGYYKSKKSAKEELESLCDSAGIRYSQAAVMTEKQHNKYLSIAQNCANENEQRALVSKIVGYDF